MKKSGTHVDFAFRLNAHTPSDEARFFFSPGKRLPESKKMHAEELPYSHFGRVSDARVVFPRPAGRLYRS